MISNAYGVFLSVRYDRARRRQFALLVEEKKSSGALAERTRELEKAQEELRCLAMTDPLTGISNRRHFMDQIAEELERTKRYSLPFSLMMIDVDNLKEINDTYGHKAGDVVLRSFAKHCLTKLRSVDRFARFGGDEFIALLVQTGPVKAKEVAVRLLAGIEDLEIQVEGKSIRITVSIGLTTTVDTLSVEELIKRTDEAMYQAKNGGRNQVVIK
jgi:diguanylate cyclase (GGDEF)-like protein